MISKMCLAAVCVLFYPYVVFAQNADNTLMQEFELASIQEVDIENIS